jgi:hypothetical protein
MMYDKIENAQFYYGTSPRVEKASTSLPRG